MDLQTLNDTSGIWACLQLQNSSLLNGTLNGSLEIPNGTCGDALLLPKTEPARPKEMDSLRILLYSLIFLLSVFGNLLIIVVLVVNKRMRTVTNSFLLSLAISDLMMAVFCMPFTLIPNLLEDFIFGAAMCKIVVYLMGISVCISTFSLVAIAIERYSAICNPLKSRAWQTRSHAYKVIASTWVLSFLIMTPYPIFSTLVKFTKPNNITAHMCRHDWPKSEVEQAWCILLLFVLFFIPGVVMIIAYGLISRELYRGIQFELEQKKGQCGIKNGISSTVLYSSDDGDGCYIQVSKRPNSMEMSALTPTGSAKVDRPRSNTSEAKLMAKKRVIRMLIVIVAMFFICWMPLYSVNTWKAFDLPSAHNALSGAPISFIHLLSYTSACVNPIIYCFMNKRFRKALLTTFSCCCWPCRRRGFKEGDDEVTATGASMSKFNYTTVSTMGPC
ncbi:cholecystokinin receptor-like protein [Labeo rohita]|uniref:Gastrin/cholecystokinin type B receptor n=4 Tax=Labeo rohita TaxID=84645 RepID=A0A498M0I7_LABRO|nr:cholecystokinin receptor isoform X1 [Labeo rohita]RXN13132.1 cholecystokinin receptor-like protein [Labeo rohita]